MTTVVLGLDGASFELIQPWIDDGSLPAFRRLVSDGAATGMQSCLPPVTCPNWQCYATGLNPGQLGVFWWELIDAADRTIESTSASHDFDGRHYWRYLDGKSAIINLPTSYPPPESVNGVHIAGGPGAEQSGYTTPEQLERELEQSYDYAVHPQHLGDLSAERTDSDCVAEIYALIDTRFDVLETYVQSGEFELVHLTVFYINVLQHFYWDHDVVRTAWERIDDRLGDLLAMEELDTLFVMSDHGSNEIDVTFNINAWLEREGYLTTTGSVSSFLHRFGITRERIRPVLASLDIEWWLRRFVPRRIQVLLPDDSGSVTKSAKGNVVNWEESVALGSGQGPLYILSDDPAERSQVREELRARLDGLTHEGQRVIEGALPAEDVYEGRYVDRGPDIVLRQAPGVHIAEALGGDHDPFESPAKWRGENKETGLFVAHGSHVDSDAQLNDMHILDIAPTVLHLQGTPVPSNVDGEVRTELFVDGSEPATREPQTQAPVGPTEEAGANVDSDVSDRLSDLGYLQ